MKALVLVMALAAATPAVAGPVVRQAAGPNAAAIQAAVDQFRADLGDPNNGNTAGSQPAGRREINWDGGGDAANIGLFPSPMPTFQNRGATFITPGSGFSISGQPTPEFADINPGYPVLFAPFSSPRLFTALNSNVSETIFHVPGDPSTPAAVTGFGAVFTDVDSDTSTKMEFYAPDGSLLYEAFVPWVAGNETVSFLGVSFDAGELIAKVRIISGNAAPGPDEAGTLDLVVMDDFIYSEPVPTQGLTITPESGTVLRSSPFALTIAIQPPAGAGIVGGRIWLDGTDVTGFLLGCFNIGWSSVGQTFTCSLPGHTLPAGDHTLQVEITLNNNSRLRNAVTWTVVP